MPAANSITVTALKIITAAGKEIGAYAAGEQIPIGDAADLLEKLQRVIDTFNARDPMIYNVNFQTFTIIPNTQPITIGPGQMFDVNQRPRDIISASVILNNTQPTQVEIRLNIRDQQWWANQIVKNLTSTYPTDLYYSPDWADGGIYLWPIPTQANAILLQIPLVLGEYTSYAQQFSMPPGYWDAIVYSLAVALGPMYERPISADLLRLRTEAIKAMQSNNIASPRGITADAGMPGTRQRGGDFNYISGLPSGY
jgi:hypothetical protein